MRGQTKTQLKSAVHPTAAPATSMFQTRPFGTESESTFGEEHDGASLFESYLQRRAAGFGHPLGTPSTSQSVRRQENRTGLPDRLKAGIETLSGYSMDEVNVHYNSSKPAQLQALAYTQGTDIHVGPGQERYLPHEAWHVVQQMQGRVRPTMQMKGVGVNDNQGLEKEADVMGGKAISTSAIQAKIKPQKQSVLPKASQVIQAVKKKKRDDAEIQKFMKKMRSSRNRNLKKKARPRKPRRFYEYQRVSNYGFNSPFNMDVSYQNQQLVPYVPSHNHKIKSSYSQIHAPGVDAYYRKGFGGQPFLYLDSERYDSKMIESNYDQIIYFFRQKDSEIAFQILNIIEGRESDVDRNTQLGQAISLFLALTQIIEPHESRIPGVDKLARALLRRIALGQLTFEQAFNRKNGLFVVAWAKKGGAPKGGQAAGRALFGISKPKDKFEENDLNEYMGEERMDQLYTTIDDYYSDESETEEDEAEKIAPDLNEDVIKRINTSLRTLQLSWELKQHVYILNLKRYEKQIQASYHKLILLNHPDRGGNFDKFNAVVNAYKYLQDWISSYDKGDDGREQRINNYLEQESLSFHEIDGNGNCFYSAVLDQIDYLDEMNVNQDLLRQRMAQLIIDNAQEFHVFVTGDSLNQMVNDILSNHSWNNQGGDFAPQLIATVLQRRVRIITPSGVQTYDPRQDLTLNNGNTFVTRSDPLTIIYNGINHYDSTRKKHIMQLM